MRRLVICYDQMVQTQKRELIKQVLDCAVGRMLEYKKKIGKLDHTLSDYQYAFYNLITSQLYNEEICCL